MADISKIQLPGDSTVYNLKDADARNRIDALESYSEYIGVTTTPLSDGASTNPIVIGGVSVTAKKGEIANYGSKEFIWNGSIWQEFGDLSALGSLAFKNSASGTYTPAGSVAAPTISVATAGSTDTIKGMASVGTLPSFTGTQYSVANETLSIQAESFSAGTLPTQTVQKTFKTGDASYSASAPAFTGTQATITVS